MNTISFKRIKLLLLADWYELKEYFLWGFLAITGLVLALLIYNNDFVFAVNQLMSIWGVLLFCGFIFGVNYARYRSYSTKGLGYLIPASPAEKFIVIITVQLFLLVCAVFIYYLTIGVFSLIAGENVIDNLFVVIGDSFTSEPISVPFLFLLLVYWLGNLSFGKNAQFKSIVLIGLSLYLLSELDSEFVSYIMYFNMQHPDGMGVTICSESIYPGVLGIVQYTAVLFICLAMIMLYIGYLKIKEREQR